MHAEIVLKATKVDGIYTDDPMKNKNAKDMSRSLLRKHWQKNLKVMDTTAWHFARKIKSLFIYSIYLKRVL